MIADARRDEAWRRATIAGGIIALHIAFAVALTWSRPPRMVIASVAMTVRAVPATVPPPVMRDSPVEAPLDAGLTLPSIEIAAAADQAPTACDVPDSLGRALQADPGTQSALAATERAPERAIMAWNGGWTERLDLQPLRRTVGVSLRTERADCLDEPVTGPRLVFVSVGGTTVPIAFGSGVWSWRSVLSNDQ